MKCSEVTFEMGDGSYEANVPWYEHCAAGALLWNPKGGEGHILVREEPCTQTRPREGAIRDCGCGGWLGDCDNTTWVCECGEDDSWRDHHYRLLAAAGGVVGDTEEQDA